MYENEHTVPNAQEGLLLQELLFKAQKLQSMIYRTKNLLQFKVKKYDASHLLWYTQRHRMIRLTTPYYLIIIIIFSPMVIKGIERLQNAAVAQDDV